MKTLIIKDLAHTEQLDRTAMTGVRGGHMSKPSYSLGNVSYAPTYDSSIDATQDLQQFQSVRNSVADGSAFVDKLNVTNDTSLFGQNNIVRL